MYSFKNNFKNIFQLQCWKNLSNNLETLTILNETIAAFLEKISFFVVFYGKSFGFETLEADQINTSILFHMMFIIFASILQT